MGNNIEGLVKPVEINGKVLTYEDSSIIGVNHYYCSTFIKNKNILVKGEHDKMKKKKRNAQILLFDYKNGDIIGESRV